MKAKFKLASHKKYKANSKSLKPATSTNPAFSIVEYKSKKYEELLLTPTNISKTQEILDHALDYFG